MVTPAGFEPATCPVGGKSLQIILFKNNVLNYISKYVYVLNTTTNARLDTQNEHTNVPGVTN